MNKGQSIPNGDSLFYLVLHLIRQGIKHVLRRRYEDVVVVGQNLSDSAARIDCFVGP
jgi:hypothetical protein